MATVYFYHGYPVFKYSNKTKWRPQRCLRKSEKWPCTFQQIGTIFRVQAIRNTSSWKAATPGHICTKFLHSTPFVWLSNLSNVGYLEGLQNIHEAGRQFSTYLLGCTLMLLTVSKYYVCRF